MLGWLLLAGACSEPGRASEPAHEPRPPDAEESSELLSSEIRVFGAAADASLPLVVALHGRGSDEERFLSFFDGLSARVRVASLRAPIDEGNGFAWWSFRGKTSDEIRRECGRLSQRIVDTTTRLTTQYPTEGPVVLVGFSQGAMLAYLIALEHPTAFETVIPVGGVLFESWVPSRLPPGFPHVVAFHGEDDPIIPVEAGRRSVSDLRRLGADAKIESYAGVPHWIMGDLKSELHRAIANALESPPG